MDRGRGGGRQVSRERSRGIYDGEREIYIYIYIYIYLQFIREGFSRSD